MDDLPFIDEQRIAVAAPAEAVWRALARQFAAPSGPRARLLAALLGAHPRTDTGAPLEIGSTMIGFAVVQANAGQRVVLAGRHRYATYALTFTIAEGPAGTTLAALTNARFPGLLGAGYRLLVIGSGAHRMVTRRILQAVRHQAQTPPVTKHAPGDPSR